MPPFQKPGPFKVAVIRFPGQNQEHPESAGYVIDLQELLVNDPRVEEIHNRYLADTPITMTRNKCIKTALAKGIDYLLMIDADMSPDCEAGAPEFWETAWEFMMDRRELEQFAFWSDASTSEDDLANGKIAGYPPATVAAPYGGPPPTESCYVFRWEERSTGDVDPNFKLAMIDRDDAARRTGIEEVAALPTGLILYDMRVFKKLPPPWFRYEWADVEETEKASTEDVYQTRNASLMGMPQFCAWDCWAAHIKTKYVVKPKPLTIKAMQTKLADALLRGREAKSF